MKLQSKSFAAVALSMIVHAAFAAPVTGLTTFTAGTPARAADVNANFAAVKTAVDDDSTRIGALQTQVATLTTQLAALQTQLTTLQGQLTNVVPLNNVLSVSQAGGITTVRFTNVNVQLVNGQGTTNTRNGAGNLIIGYDEVRTTGPMQCSVGVNPNTGDEANDATKCANAGGTWALNHKTGSHNVIVGPQHNYSRWGGVVLGTANSSLFDYATVTGGYNNVAGSYAASVSGGGGGRAVGEASSIGAGNGNIASGVRSGVSGGSNNTAQGTESNVSGGYANIASGTQSSITAGAVNVASGPQSGVSGGGGNSATGTESSVSGGGGNTASLTDSSVSGGDNNLASGNNASVSGGANNIASGLDSSVTGGRTNTASGVGTSVSGGASRTSVNPDDWRAGTLFQDN